MKRKKWLATAVLGTIMTLRLATPVCAAADRAAEEAETHSGALDQYDIGDMVVTAHRDAGEAFVAREGTVGILGTQDTMDTPFYGDEHHGKDRRILYESNPAFGQYAGGISFHSSVRQYPSQ